jgi:hypothetical protein
MNQAPPQVLELIQRFDRNREAYRSPHYNETQLRREFLDPLFQALGWDIDNKEGYAEAYKDVVHEDAIKVGEATKAPDYCFRIGGTRKFLLEAKRPSVDIKNDASPAFQLRRYAWTVKLSLSVLSDFEEFAVYDCRFKPDHQQSAALGRVLYIPYTEYARRWDEIAGVFSREAVLRGSFDKFAESIKAKRGTADVDDEFLKTIETWRADLARNLALRNPKLSQRELNFAVQRIIDRIIFLRICEDRGIEDYGRLRALINGNRIYPRLCQLFEAADARYNSGLFHFKAEEGRHEAPDELTLALDVDDKLLHDIIKAIYYPESPYVFAKFPADVLGHGVPLHGRYGYKKTKVEKALPALAPFKSEWEGGFDAVIGNPPYVRIQGFPADQIQYLTTHYRSATGNCDLYVSFIERSLSLLSQGGTLGMIAPNKFFRTDYGKGLRGFLSGRRAVRRIVDFGANQVFAATTYTCLLFLQKRASDSFEYTQSKADQASLLSANFSRRDSNALGSSSWTFESPDTTLLLAKLEKDATRLLELPADMGRGSSTGDDKVFVFETGSLKIEEGIVREPLFASDFGRYSFAPSRKWKVIFPYHVSEGGAYRLYSEQELKTKFPRAFAYLYENQPALRRRKQYTEWFGYSAARNLELHDQAQIAVPLLANGGLFAFIPNNQRGRLCPMASGGFTVTIGKESRLKPEYVLGLLNSKLLFWRLGTLSNIFRGGWITCTKQYFGALPIRNIDFSSPADKSRHDQVVHLVEQMLSLHQRLSAAARTPQEKTALERQITATDTQMDRLVYDLYGLTQEEIKIVERAV